MKKFTKQAALALATGRPLSLLHRALTRDAATIFMLHRFTDPERGVEGHDPDQLRRFLAWLRRRDRPLLRIDDLVRRTRAGAPLKGAVAFTVDDGYADFATVGMDVFAEFDCPVTVFLPTSFVDGDEWMWWDNVRLMLEKTTVPRMAFSVEGDEGSTNALPLTTTAEKMSAYHELVNDLKPLARNDRERALSSLSRALDVRLSSQVEDPRFRAMTWEEVKECASRGASFGPHTCTHPWLSSGTEDEVRGEIEESWRRLQEQLESPTPVFCYPYGEREAFGNREMRLVRDCGLQGALSAVPRMVTSAHSREEALYQLPRFGLPSDVLRARKIATGIIRLQR